MSLREEDPQLCFFSSLTTKLCFTLKSLFTCIRAVHQCLLALCYKFKMSHNVNTDENSLSPNKIILHITSHQPSLLSHLIHFIFTDVPFAFCIHTDKGHTETRVRKVIFKKHGMGGGLQITLISKRNYTSTNLRFFKCYSAKKNLGYLKGNICRLLLILVFLAWTFRAITF